MIPMPVISGPTSGSTYCEEIQEFVRQSERWTIGACEARRLATRTRCGMDGDGKRWA